MLIVKDEGTVYIAASTTAVLYCGYMDQASCLLPENLQVWKVPNDDGIVACAAGSGFEGDVFRYDGKLIEGELTKEKLVLETVPKLRRVLGRYGKLDKDGDMQVRCAFAQKDRVFVISTGFCVSEITDCAAYGRNAGRGTSALRIAKEMKPEERILFARRITHENERSPLAFIDTATLTPRIVGVEASGKEETE